MKLFIPLPLIETRDEILTQYRTLGIGNGYTSFTKQQVYNKQKEVSDVISLIESDWSAYQAESIRSMLFNPKEAWKSVKILSVNATIHHKNPTIMRMQLTYG